MEITLDLLNPGKAARVTRIETIAYLRKRLEDYGLVPGTIVRCRYRSPRGDVTALAFRGAVVALRTRDLKRIAGVS